MEYYRCEWLVLPLLAPIDGGLLAIDQTISQFDCKLILQPYTMWKVRSDGCHILPFIWCVPSEEQMLRCLEILNNYIQFTNFTSAHEEDAVGNSHPFFPMVSNFDLIKHISELGQRNQQILSQQ